MPSEDYQNVINALRTKPRMCRHALSEATGLPHQSLRNALQSLQHSGTVERVPGVDSTDKVYRLKDQSLVLEQDITKARLPVLCGLDETTARDRVFLIKRLKNRLIESYHPALDLIMNDYVQGLDYLESLREHLDDDDLKSEVENVD